MKIKLDDLEHFEIKDNELGFEDLEDIAQSTITKIYFLKDKEVNIND